MPSVERIISSTLRRGKKKKFPFCDEQLTLLDFSRQKSGCENSFDISHQNSEIFFVSGQKSDGASCQKSGVTSRQKSDSSHQKSDASRQKADSSRRKSGDTIGQISECWRTGRVTNKQKGPLSAYSCLQWPLRCLRCCSCSDSDTDSVVDELLSEKDPANLDGAKSCGQTDLGYINFGCAISTPSLPDVVQSVLPHVVQPDLPNVVQSPHVVQDAVVPADIAPPSPSNAQRPKSDYFVFVLAGDYDNRREPLLQELSALSQQLTVQNVPHVIMSSVQRWPKVKLRSHILRQLPSLTEEDPVQVDKFLREALKKASKILMMISPGYWTYADEYARGAAAAETELQRCIRSYHKIVKDEWFYPSCKRNRIWPVVLTGTNPVRAQFPSFLLSALFYCFPAEPQDEEHNVVSLLKGELLRDRRRIKLLPVA